MIQITLKIECELTDGHTDYKDDMLLTLIEEDCHLLSPDKYSKVHMLLNEIGKSLIELK